MFLQFGDQDHFSSLWSSVLETSTGPPPPEFPDKYIHFSPDGYRRAVDLIFLAIESHQLEAALRVYFTVFYKSGEMSYIISRTQTELVALKNALSSAWLSAYSSATKDRNLETITTLSRWLPTTFLGEKPSQLHVAFLSLWRVLLSPGPKDIPMVLNVWNLLERNQFFGLSHVYSVFDEVEKLTLQAFRANVPPLGVKMAFSLPEAHRISLIRSATAEATTGHTPTIEAFHLFRLVDVCLEQVTPSTGQALKQSLQDSYKALSPKVERESQTWTRADMENLQSVANIETRKDFSSLLLKLMSQHRKIYLSKSEALELSVLVIRLLEREPDWAIVQETLMNFYGVGMVKGVGLVTGEGRIMGKTFLAWKRLLQVATHQGQPHWVQIAVKALGTSKVVSREISESLSDFHVLWYHVQSRNLEAFQVDWNHMFSSKLSPHLENSFIKGALVDLALFGLRAKLPDIPIEILKVLSAPEFYRFYSSASEMLDPLENAVLLHGIELAVARHHQDLGVVHQDLTPPPNVLPDLPGNPHSHAEPITPHVFHF